MSDEKRTVEMRFTTVESKWGKYREELDLLVDGETISGGSYGGEPEDNYRSRDYSWVEHALTALATRLGAEVKTVQLTREEP